MNIAITNIAFSPSYSIACSLRSSVTNLIGIGDKGIPKYFSKSKIYDKIYHITLPRENWTIGDINPKPDESEEKYFKYLMKICSREKIDVIFPSHDYDLFLLSKLKENIENNGVIPVCPDFKTFIKIADKARIIEAAAEVGLPHPRTIECYQKEDVKLAIEQLGFPLIVKARFSAGGAYVQIARDERSLNQFIKRLGLLNRHPILQEWIPGTVERSFHYLINKNEVQCAFCLRKLHHLRASFSTAIQVSSPVTELGLGAVLLKHLKYEGFAVLQTRLDQRTGHYKLIEINPRWGNNGRILIPMLLQQGLNLPLECTKNLLGQSKVKFSVNIGSLGSSPIEDFIAGILYIIRRIRSLFISRRFQTYAKGPSVFSLVWSYINLYSRMPVLDDYFKAIIKDFSVARGYYISVIKNLINRNQFDNDMAPWGDLDVQQKHFLK